MVVSARYIQDNFTIAFPRDPEIRRKANEIEDHLGNNFTQPQVLGIPDEWDPQVPRLLFVSQHGFSRIVISQISIVFSVNYSTDFQEDKQKRGSYLTERVLPLFDLLPKLKGGQACYCGLASRARIPCSEACPDFSTRLARVLLTELHMGASHGLVVRGTTVIENRFFINTTVENYVMWKAATPTEGPQRLRSDDVIERGIQITDDVNDRYAFNEYTDYFTSPDTAREILSQASDHLQSVAQRIQESLCL